jgi:hypothetical protein
LLSISPISSQAPGKKRSAVRSLPLATLFQ